MNKTIIITGASKGIGRELVLKFSNDQSNNIYALSRDLNKMKESFSHLKNVHCIAFDLTLDIKKQLDHILKTEEKIDVLINNAGILINKKFCQLSNEDLFLSYQVNVFGIIKIVQILLPKFHSNSHIVNISSMGGYQGSVKFPGLTAYSSSKAALCNITEMFAEEYKETGISMNCLCLGAVQTEMLENAFPGYKAPLNASEISNYISEFAINGNKYFNGKIIPVSLSTP